MPSKTFTRLLLTMTGGGPADGDLRNITIDHADDTDPLLWCVPRRRDPSLVHRYEETARVGGVVQMTYRGVFARD